jgi:isoquinoline 1-oxidoreductase beta subunit
VIHHRPQGFDSYLPGGGLLISGAVIDGGLMLSLTLPFGRVEVGSRTFSPKAFIRIDSDGQVFLTLPYVEGEEDSYTLIPLLIAEELEVTPNQVHLEHAPPNERLHFNPVLAGQTATGNSDAIRSAWKPLREAGATARTMLIAVAAKRWDVDARSCHAHEGEVIHTTTWRKLRYGELAGEAARIPIPKNVAQKQLVLSAVAVHTKGRCE